MVKNLTRFDVSDMELSNNKSIANYIVMCFSLEASLSAGIGSWVIGLYLLTKKLTTTQRHNVIFLLIFSSIQFADAILWYIKMKKNNINYIVTSFVIPFILSLQIIYNMFFINKINNPYIIILIVAYIMYIWKVINGYSIDSKNQYNSPTWGHFDNPNPSVYGLSLGLVLLVLLAYGRDDFTRNIMCITFLISGFLNLRGVGSLWCAISTVLSLYYLYKY